MSWRRIAESFQALLAHAFLFSCTLLLAFKLDHAVLYSWWMVFAPLWLFHAIVARGRFSLPAPTLPHDRYWAPWHAVMAIPLLVAFELLLCIHLGSGDVVNLKIVFTPLLVFEIAILIDNVRMCKALMPGEEETISDEIIWKTLPHFWVAISMVFFIAATIFTLLKLSGNAASLGWWDLFINFGIAECFAFLVFTKWYNPVIHVNAFREPNRRSHTIRNLDWISGSMVSSDEDQHQSQLCNLQDLGGHLIKVLMIIFQILLFMRLEGTPSSVRHIPWRILFIPLYLIQGIGAIFATHRLGEKIVLLFRGSTSHRYFLLSSKAHEFFGFLHHGSRLLGWWSIDEVSREEQAKLYCGGSSGYNTFSPEAVKQMPKSNLIDEIWRLQAALSEQTEITKFSQQEHERLQNEKILCRICFAEEINVVLLPCRHHILCSTCCEKCTRCPICRESIERGMLYMMYSLETPIG